MSLVFDGRLGSEGGKWGRNKGEWTIASIDLERNQQLFRKKRRVEKKPVSPRETSHVVFDTRPRSNDNTGGPVNCNFPIKMPNSPITRRKWTASIGFPLSSQRRDNLRLNSRLVPADHCASLRVAPRPVIVAAVACSSPSSSSSERLAFIPSPFARVAGPRQPDSPFVYLPCPRVSVIGSLSLTSAAIS